MNAISTHDALPKIAESASNPIFTAPTRVQDRAVQQIGQEHGSTIPDFEEKRRLFTKRRVSRKQTTGAISMRLFIADWNKFQMYCEATGSTVGEAFSHLVAALPNVSAQVTIRGGER